MRLSPGVQSQKLSGAMSIGTTSSLSGYSQTSYAGSTGSISQGLAGMSQPTARIGSATTYSQTATAQSFSQSTTASSYTQKASTFGTLGTCSSFSQGNAGTGMPQTVTARGVSQGTLGSSFLQSAGSIAPTAAQQVTYGSSSSQAAAPSSLQYMSQAAVSSCVSPALGTQPLGYSSLSQTMAACSFPQDTIPLDTFYTGSVPQQVAADIIQNSLTQTFVQQVDSSQPMPPAQGIGRVEYFSSSKRAWIPASFIGFNTEFNTYTLDVQPYAQPGDVRLAPGALAEYFSKTRGGWVPAQVDHFNEEFGVYALDVQPYAKPEDVRLAGFEEPLQPPCMDGRRAVAASLDDNAGNSSPVKPRSSTGEIQEMLEEEDEEEAARIAEIVKASSGSDRLPVGARVEYFGTKSTEWLKAKVLGFDEEIGTYRLSCRPYALAGHMRVPGREEATIPEAEAEGALEGNTEACKPLLSVPQYSVQKQRESGKTTFAVFIKANDGSLIRAFDGDCTTFELTCEAEPLHMWLDGLSQDMLPGLLTLLQHEVEDRHKRLADMQAEKDTLRGADYYEYFGLSEASTEKDIDRAYRKASKELHPDKGGDEEEFQEMRRRYEQLKQNRGEGPKKNVVVEEGDPLSWDPADRASMLTAHDRMRSFLVWVTNDLTAAAKELEELRRRRTQLEASRGCLEDRGTGGPS